MKLNKKKVFTLALAVCLIAILSMTSLAWFTDTDEITNDFYVGDTDTPADEVFGIEVWEDRDTNGDGDYNEIGDAEKADGLKYETILPGEVLSKEPYLENTGIHPQFVRAIVTVSDGYTLMEAMAGKWGDASLFLAGTPESWTLDQVLFTEDHELVYIYYYNKVLEAGTVTDKIFTDVVIPTEMTKEMAAVIDNFQVKILGQAIQAEHLADPDAPGSMVTTAQRAFELYWDAEDTTANIPNDQIIGRGGEDIVLEETAENYYVMDKVETVSLTDATLKVSNAVVSIPTEITDGVILIDGLVVTGGGKIVVREHTEETAASTIWVYVNTDKPLTVDGVEVTRDNWQDYFVGVAHVDFYGWG